MTLGMTNRLFCAALALAVLYCFQSFPFVTYKQTIDVSRISKNGEHSYYVELPADAPDPDNSDTPFASTVFLYENGAPLGRAHSLHKEIADLGAGRFSHWGIIGKSGLIFSTSDNSDPRTNGRAYGIKAQYRPPNLVFVLVGIPLAIFLFARAVGAKRMPAFQALLVVGLLAVWLRLLHGFVAYYPDAFTYYFWYPTVPLGYPLFLSALGSLAWVTDAQLIMLCGAILFLCLAVNRISTAAGLATLLLLASPTQLFYQQASILSEGLFLPLLLVNVGAAIFTVTAPQHRGWPVLVALSAAGIMFVRPAGYYAPLGILFLLLAMRSNFVYLLKWALGPLAIFLAVSFAANLAVRGSGSQSQVGRVLFPFVATLYNPAFSADTDPDINQEIAAVVEPYRQKFAQETTALGRFKFAANNYNFILLAVENAIAKKHNATPEDPTYFRQLDKIYLRLFFQTILNQPLGYLGLVRDQLFAAWSTGVLAAYTTPDRSMEAEDGLFEWRKTVTASRKLPLSTATLVPDISRYSGLTKVVLDELSNIYQKIQSERWLTHLMGMVTLLAIPFALFRPSLHMVALGYCGVMIHGSILLTATTTVFLSRYALPVDPLLLVAGAIFVDGLLRWVSGRTRRTTAARPKRQEAAEVFTPRAPFCF
ncbi:MAG: pectate lyase [Bradyrhizobium sp.]|jgi:hypothetical protein|nr:pectate lyase [Bradyrhizobium sp.]